MIRSDSFSRLEEIMNEDRVKGKVKDIAGRTERKSVAGPLATLVPRGSSVGTG